MTQKVLSKARHVTRQYRRSFVDLSVNLDSSFVDWGNQTNTPSTFCSGFHDDNSVSKMEYRSLQGTDMKVSKLAFGASSLGSVFRETNLEESIETVHGTIRHGVNFIDVAPWYGHGKAETVLGKALKEVPRSSYFLSTKVGRYKADPLEMFDFTAKRTIKSVDESLERLGIDYIDVIQVHDPEFSPNLDIIVNETLPALDEVRKSGKARYIGVTGYPLDMQKYLIENSPVEINTSLVYCHYSLNDTTLLEFLPFLQSKGVGCINASPVSMGLLTHRGPPVWHPAPEETKQVAIEAAQYCEKNGVNLEKLALHFSLGNKEIPTTLISTASLSRAMDNIKACSEKLNDVEMQVLQHLQENIFSKLKGKEVWEQLDVPRYWEKVGRKSMIKQLYGEKYMKK